MSAKSGFESELLRVYDKELLITIIIIHTDNTPGKFDTVPSWEQDISRHSLDQKLSSDCERGNHRPRESKSRKLKMKFKTLIFLMTTSLAFIVIEAAPRGNEKFKLLLLVNAYKM